MASWTQKKQLFAIGAGAGFICAVAFGGVYYAHGLIEEVSASIATKQQAMTVADSKIAQIPTLEREVVILRENLGEYVKILPDTKELSEFVRMVNQFQRQSGIFGQGLQLKSSGGAKGPQRFALIEYTFQMTATVWEFLKFVNLVENYERFVSVSDFSVISGDKGRGEEYRDGDVVHNVNLTLQTYSYNGKASGKDVLIPDYEGHVEALREEIFARLQKIRIERYQHRGSQGRRDILVDPRLRGDVNPGGTSPSEQKAILERYIAEIVKLKEMFSRMRQKDTTMFEQYALEKTVRDGLAKAASELAGDAGRMSYAPYRLRWTKEVVTPLEELQTALELGDKAKVGIVDPFLTKKEMEQIVAQLEADCQAGQLEEAKIRYEGVAAKLAVPTDDPRHALAVLAKAWHVKATTALDFRNLQMRFQGVVVNRDGRSGVLLNGEVFEEGEYVSDDLLVKRVEEEQIWFVFRGLTLVRTM